MFLVNIRSFVRDLDHRWPENVKREFQNKTRSTNEAALAIDYPPRD